MKLPKGKYLLLAIIVPVVVILDQLTKILAVSGLSRENVNGVRVADGVVSVIDGFFRLRYAENTGAAWSLLGGLSSGVRVPLFIGVTILAIAFMLWFFHRIEAKQRLLAAALASVLGGAVGNLIDRIRVGYVVDFIQWYVTFDKPHNLGLFTIEAGEKQWPTFNIADAAITVGVVLLLLEMIFGHSKNQKAQEQAEKPPQAAKG